MKESLPGRMIRFGSGLTQRLVRDLRNRLSPHVVILLYHRVIDLPFDPQLLCVTPEHFEEHLEILRRYNHPVSLKELAKALQEGTLPRRGVVITFDDGYLDNLQYARPLLEQFEIPATVFVVAGQVGRQEEFWWDELERLFLMPGKLPESLTLEINGSDYHWETSGGGRSSASVEYTNADLRRFQNWHVEQAEDPSPRHELYRSIYQFLHSLPDTEKRGVLERLRAWAGQEPFYRPSHRTLTQDEVLLLAEGGLIEVGAHTMTHPLLGSLPVSMQRQEIQHSKAHLEEIINQPLRSFAYPHGSYTKRTISLVREAGFEYACSSNTDAVWRGADRFKLPRLVVRDWDGDEFRRRLKGWMGE